MYFRATRLKSIFVKVHVSNKLVAYSLQWMAKHLAYFTCVSIFRKVRVTLVILFTTAVKQIELTRSMCSFCACARYLSPKRGRQAGYMLNIHKTNHNNHRKYNYTDIKHLQVCVKCEWINVASLARGSSLTKSSQ